MNHDISTKQLRYFVAVAQELHFGRAALRLHITQPPLSRQIRALEEQLGARLIDRNTQTVQLTPSGRTFMRSAQAILESIDQAVATIRQTKVEQTVTPEAPLLSGYTSALDPGAFPDLRQWLRQTGFTLQPQPRFARSVELVKAVRNGQLDLAFIALPAATGSLSVVRLGRDRMVLALPAPHRLARRAKVSLQALNGEPVLWFARAGNPVYFDHARGLFEQIGFRPIWRHEPEQFHLLLGQVANGAGAGLVPESMTRTARAGVRFVALQEADRLAIDLGVVCRPDGRARRLVDALAGAELPTTSS
jgi:DNA-binding transcriptional LysR family regulator